MKSIMHNKQDGTCYLCMMLNWDYQRREGLEEHHVFGGPCKKLSTKYGLTVYLCHEHHTEPPEGAHRNKANMDLLHKEGQRAFMKRYPGKDFMEIFGRNYL